MKVDRGRDAAGADASLLICAARTTTSPQSPSPALPRSTAKRSRNPVSNSSAMLHLLIQPRLTRLLESPTKRRTGLVERRRDRPLTHPGRLRDLPIRQIREVM